MFRQCAVVLLLALIACLCYGCSSGEKCTSRLILEPELLFPSLSEYEPRAADDTEERITAFTLALGKTALDLVPFNIGSVINTLLTTAEDTLNLLKTAEDGFAKLVDTKLGIDAIDRINRQTITIQDRIKDAKRDIDTDPSIVTALHNADQILLEFNSTKSALSRGENVLASSPSLMSFTGLYTGLVTLAVLRTPKRKEDVLEKLMILQQTLSSYQKVAVERRLSLVETYSPYTPPEHFCRDTYYDLIGSKLACPGQSVYDCRVNDPDYKYAGKAKVVMAWFPESILGDGESSTEQKIKRGYYRKRMASKYWAYFADPMYSLSKFIEKFEK